MTQRMSVWSDDLKFAAQMRVMAEIDMVSGTHYFVGVHSVDDDRDLVVVYEPIGMSGASTLKKIRMDDISSVNVTEVMHNLNVGDESM